MLAVKNTSIHLKFYVTQTSKIMFSYKNLLVFIPPLIISSKVLSKVKLSYVLSILKPYFPAYAEVVACAITSRMYPYREYFLVK